MADRESPQGKPEKSVNCNTTAEYTADTVTHYKG